MYLQTSKKVLKCHVQDVFGPPRLAPYPQASQIWPQTQQNWYYAFCCWHGSHRPHAPKKNWHLSPTIPSLVRGYAWAITPLLQSLGMAPPSSLWTIRWYSSKIVSTFPTSKIPYSLQAHQRHRSCSFIGIHGLGFHVFFPTFIIKVDTATNCHLNYAPVVQLAELPNLDYDQPKFPPIASALATSAALPPPVTIQPDDDTDDIQFECCNVLWKGMHTTIRSLTKSCRSCQINKNGPVDMDAFHQRLS